MQKAKEIVNRILMERQRQIEEKGWTPEHDMEHSDGSLANAAAAYALGRAILFEGRNCNGVMARVKLEAWHGFSDATVQSKPRIQQLVIAGALIVAEIERLETALAEVEGK